jgi:hypothetical protein
MVTMAGKGTRKHLRQAMEILSRVDAPVAGVVLNSVGPDRHTYQYGGGYYGVPSGQDNTPSPPPSQRRGQAANGARGQGPPTNGTKPAKPVRPAKGRAGTPLS